MPPHLPRTTSTLLPTSLRTSRNHATLLSLRHQSTTSTLNTIDISPAFPSSSSRSSAVLTPIPNRSVLKLSGRDSSKFLKGLTTKDIDSLPGGGYSAFLAANGRVLHDVFVYPFQETVNSTTTSTSAATQMAYLIDYPNGPSTTLTTSSPSTTGVDLTDEEGAAAASGYIPLMKYIKKFILRSKVRIRDVSEEYDIYSSFGSATASMSSGLESASASASASESMAEPRAVWKFGSGGAAEVHWEGLPDVGQGMKEGELACWDMRAGWGSEGMGRRHLVRKGDKPTLPTPHLLLPSTAYSLRRMVLGVPEGSDELIPGVAFPLESNMDVMSGIDFRKGCYVGQELTVRTYHTGHTRKRIMPIRFLPSSSSASASASASSSSSSPSPCSSYLPPNRPPLWSSLSSPPHPHPHPEPLTPIEYIPPLSAPSQKRKSAVKILAVHPEYAIGLGLMRLEMVERVWGAQPYGEAQQSEALKEGERDDDDGDVGRLGVKGTEDWSVWAGRGRAWYPPPSLEDGA